MSKNREVQRPNLPLLLLCALSMWAGAASTYQYSCNLETEHLVNISVICIALCLLFVLLFAILLLRGHSDKAVCKLLATFSFLLLGISLGFLGCNSYFTQRDSIQETSSSFDVVLSSDVKTSDYGASAEATLNLSDRKTIKCKIYFEDEPTLYTGCHLSIDGRLSQIPEKNIEQNYTNGIVGQVKVKSYTVEENPLPFGYVYSLRERAISLFEEYAGESAGLLEALVCGYRTNISASGEYDYYKQCGLAHIVAVSGAHLSIVTSMFGLVISALNCPKKLRLVLSSFFVLCYLIFAGIPISAIRASVMTLLSLMSGAIGRRSASLNALAICIIAFLALDITASVSVSLFLSAGATLGIILFSPLFSSWMGKKSSSHEKTEAIGKGIIEPLALTFSSNLVTLPFSVATFSMLPLVAPLANIVATPLFSVACVCGLAAVLLSCVLAPLTNILIGFASICARPLSISVKLIASIPYGCINLEADAVLMLIITAVTICALWVIWPKSPKGILKLSSLVIIFALATFIFKFNTVHGDEIVMLDVGQGDSFLIRSGEKNILIDTGNQDEKLISGLLGEGITHLDAVLITHSDDDHCGCLNELSLTTDVDKVIVASDMLSCECKNCTSLINDVRTKFGNENLCGVNVGQTIKVGNFNLEVIWPNSYTDKGGNADSLCVLAKLDCDSDGSTDYSSLFTGDAEKDELKEMISEDRVGDIDVLKVGHHGSKVSLDSEIASTLKPELSLISVGASNTYGHPSSEVLGIIEKTRSEVYRTDKDGTIHIVFSKNEMKVQ